MQVPLLATGYLYTNDVSFPWNNPERSKLVNVSPYDWIPNVTYTDKIRIMNSEGSVITLVNPTSRSNYLPLDTTRWDYHLIGEYFDSDEKSNGYAIVKWKDQVYELRRIWYKPGDGLTYYFEEEYPSYQNLGSWAAWGSRETNRPKIAYLRYVQSQNGDRIAFSYDSLSVFGTNVTRGRKYLKSIQYFKNGAPVSGTAITLSYVKNANNTYQINIQSALSGESFTVGLSNYNPTNNTNFDNISRDSSSTFSNIMEVNSITNSSNPNKTVSFGYLNHIRKYTYGPFSIAAYECAPCNQCGPNFFQSQYYLEFPTKILTSREVFHGEKETFDYWVDTQLDGTTPMYDITSSYSVSSLWWNLGSCGGGVQRAIPPWEYSQLQGYYINTYMNAPNSSYKYYRYYMHDSYYWQLYLSGYHFGNMNHSMRDNYTSVMMKTLTSRIYNDRTGNFDPLRKRDYSYTWGHTLYWGQGGSFENCVQNYSSIYALEPFVLYTDQQYCDISPRTTNIITQITTTNLSQEQNSAQHSYVEKKNFEILKVSSKFRGRYGDILTPKKTYTETRLDTESVYDASGSLLQSIAYSYNDNVTQRNTQSNYQLYVMFYDRISPSDLGLASKVISYNGAAKATVFDSQTINTFGHWLGSTPGNGCWPDSCIVKNISEDISTTSETYRQSSLAQSVKQDEIFTSNFGITASTSYTDTNFIYRPTLPTEQLTYVQKGTTGNFNRVSRSVSTYSQGSSVNYGKLSQQTTYAVTDNAPVTTTYIYDSTGSYSGYLRRILYDNGSDVQYKYNSEIDPTGKLYCSDGSTITNPAVYWSGAFQPAPFQTIKDYNSRSLATFTAYDGKANLFFAVDENGYYSANYYDTLGRITKQLKPGNFYPNNPYLPPNGASAPYSSMTFSYVDSLWTSKVTSTGYLYNAGANVQTMTQFRPDSLANENYAYTGTSWELKSKEKVNYLGRKWYSRDGDGVSAFYYYDAFLTPRQTRFTDSSSSAPATQQVTDFNGGQTYFKRVKLTDENGNYGYSYYDLYGNILKSEKYLGTKVLTTRFTYNGLGRLDSVITPEGKATKYIYDVRGNDSVHITPDAGMTRYLYDKFHNLRLIKDANHAGTAINYGTVVSQGGSQNSSGSFPMYMPGKVSLSITFGGGAPSGTISITRNNVTICSATNTGSGTITSSIILPKGTYGWTFTMTSPGQAYYSYSATCGNANQLVYDKFDGLHRLVETGEYTANDTVHFTQAYADDASFPTSNTLVTKQYLYDTLSGDPNASNQRNLKGRISATYAYRFGQICNQTSYSYDELGRVEWEVQTNLGSYPKKLYYRYDLQGNVSKKGYCDLHTNYNTYTFYDYDQEGRLLRVWTDTDSLGTTKVKDAEYSYFPSNRVQQVKLGATPAQTVDYTYNNRGWLRKINDPDAMGTDKFAMTLGYETQDKAGSSLPFTAQKNGNISWVAYRLAGVTLPYGSTDYVCRAFGYDSTNRLTKAPFGYCSGSNWYGAGTRYGEFYSYSDDGNFITLGRHDSTGARTDSLLYLYTGTNRLDSVYNSAGASSKYTYDSNGNVVSDSRSNIAFTIYDINNLPVAIYTTTGTSQVYAYDVNGSRVRKYASNGTDTYYLNDPTGKTELVQQGVYNSVYTYNISGADNIGQVMRNGVRLWRYYYLKDHLGSVRMIVNTSGSIDSYNDLYPYGMLMPGRTLTTSADARFKFTGKERDVETNYDYFGARYYDARVGRWLAADRFAAKYPDLSPYAYAANNPNAFIDQNGDSLELCGVAAEAFLRLLASRTGLVLKQNGTGSIYVDPDAKIQSDGTSASLRELVTDVLGSTSTNLKVVAIGESGKVFFDADARTADAGSEGVVDMGDFSAISNAPELQSALLGHIVKERATAGPFEEAHAAGLAMETKIMKELSSGADIQPRTSPFSDPHSSSYMVGKGPKDGLFYFNDFDYGSRSYYIATPWQKPLNPNIVQGVVEVRK